MKCDLQGKVSLVTGAARSIGLGIADRLIANGSIVYYTDIDEETVRSVATHENARALPLDITNAEQVNSVIEQVVSESGKLDILVNNAGINTIHERVTIDEFPQEVWDRIIDVDLNGLYLMCRSSARVMKKQGAGRIINISSVFGLVPARLQCAFVAAKAGGVNLTRAMALELGPHGILVNGVAPGSTLTKGTEKLFYGDDGKFNTQVQEFMNHVPLGRPATTDEIAVAVLFLADPENSYMNGHVLPVDGGWMAGYHRDF